MEPTKPRRSEIQGLRAVAVLAVVFYHAEIVLFGRDWFTGGYIGVDVFFVISGYLISRIIFSEIDATGRLDYQRFYTKRVRRILPVLLLVMVVTVPFAYLYLLPQDLVDMAESQLASLAMVSNVYFYLSSTEYGAAPGLLMPFLHTWSLSVEEQFYIALPIIALVLARFGNGRLLPLTMLLVTSLAACVLLRPSDQQFAFFMPIARAWELLAGSLFAAYELRHGRPSQARIAPAMAGLGLLLILWPISAFGNTTEHPGLLTLIPVTGTVLLLAFANPRGVVGKGLSLPPVRYIGEISYSVYLWHYPIFALWRTVDYEFTNIDKALAIGLTTVLSVASFHFVEEPFRTRRWPVWRFSGFGATATAGIAAFVLFYSGFPARLDRVVAPEAIARENAAEAQFATYVGEPGSTKPMILIIGDSYTRNWSVALNRFVDHARFDVVSISYLGCDLSFEGDALEVASTSANYDQYCTPLKDYLSDKTVLARTEAVFLTSHRPFEYSANLGRFDLLNWIKQIAPDPEIFIFGNFYQLDNQKHGTCLKLMFHTHRDASICMDLASYPLESSSLETLPHYPHGLDFTYVDFLGLLCPRRAPCEAEAGGLPFMMDWNHLTATFLTYALDVIFERQGDEVRELALDQYLAPKTTLAWQASE